MSVYLGQCGCLLIEDHWVHYKDILSSNYRNLGQMTVCKIIINQVREMNDTSFTMKIPCHGEFIYWQWSITRWHTFSAFEYFCLLLHFPFISLVKWSLKWIRYRKMLIYTADFAHDWNSRCFVQILWMIMKGNVSPSSKWGKVKPEQVLSIIHNFSSLSVSVWHSNYAIS